MNSACNSTANSGYCEQQVSLVKKTFPVEEDIKELAIFEMGIFF